MPLRFQHLISTLLTLVVVASVPGRVDGQTDKKIDQVRRIPKLGVEVPEADQKELVEGLEALAAKIEKVRAADSMIGKELLPDVLIFHRAVDQALRFQEFFDVKDIAAAKALLVQGSERADELLAGQARWTKQAGLVVRGYISKIDRTVQPYGLVIPANYDFEGTTPHRLDFWFHGRGEVLSEVNFLDDRVKNVGQISPEKTIVLHPYGRYCNANKLAGEVDTLECLDVVKKQYRIDVDRVSVRGFSMGGAAVWQFAVHYPDHWFAANPGAGFADTPGFLGFYRRDKLDIAPYERTLWRMYDCPGYAANLAHLPTVAYSGEKDGQKQAADLMAAAMEREGMTLLHIIGPGTGHKIHPDSAVEIEAKMQEWAAKGIDRQPKKVQLVTFTLKYNRMHWLTIDGLGEHWEEARIKVDFAEDHWDVTTKNVSAFTLHPPAGTPRQVQIDGQSTQSLPADGAFVLHNKEWIPGHPTGLRKKHDLQGPIDDALMDSFIFVRPTGTCRNEVVDHWVQSELEHAVTHWRRQMRGDAIVKLDRDISPEDIASSNLILWGDLQANQFLAKIADQLPIRWTVSEVIVGQNHYDAADHIPLLIYPNPLNPEKYIVLNSSFTYREVDYLNNALQIPKLPDWAILDIRTPANSRSPGKIVEADFFNERWELKSR